MGDYDILMSFCHWGKKCTILVSDVDNGGGYGYGGGVYGKSLYLPSNFIGNLKLL